VFEVVLSIFLVDPLVENVDRHDVCPGSLHGQLVDSLKLQHCYGLSLYAVLIPLYQPLYRFLVVIGEQFFLLFNSRVHFLFLVEFTHNLLLLLLLLPITNGLRMLRHEIFLRSVHVALLPNRFSSQHDMHSEVFVIFFASFFDHEHSVLEVEIVADEVSDHVFLRRHRLLVVERRQTDRYP